MKIRRWVVVGARFTHHVSHGVMNVASYVSDAT